jgi:ferredoxin
MPSKVIELCITDRFGNDRVLHLQPDLGENLMEVLKSFSYNMRATCGGLGLCADCHCQILAGTEIEKVPLTEQEHCTLDALPDSTKSSRLACQIKIGNYLHNSKLKLLGA